MLSRRLSRRRWLRWLDIENTRVNFTLTRRINYVRQKSIQTTTTTTYSAAGQWPLCGISTKDYFPAPHHGAPKTSRRTLSIYPAIRIRMNYPECTWKGRKLTLFQDTILVNTWLPVSRRFTLDTVLHHLPLVLFSLAHPWNIKKRKRSKVRP